MSTPPASRDPQCTARSLRRGVYLLLAAASIAQVTARLMALNSVDLAAYDAYRISTELNKSRQSYIAAGGEGEALDKAVKDRKRELEEKFRSERPFLSGNDRSRWLTVRALVEYNTYAIDKIVCDPVQGRLWDTIDMVKHVDAQGEPHLYSSKPPLLSTIVAGEYWLLYHTTGLSLRDHPFAAGRILLWFTNVIPLGLYFWLLARILERYGHTDWGRLFVMTAAAFGTFLTTFAIVLNNHILAAFCVMAALDAALRIWYEGRRELRYYAIAGLFAALSAAMELPALSFCALLGAALAYRAPRATLLAFLPAAAVVGAAAVGTNYLAHGTVRPAYAFRTEGKDWQTGNWYNYTYQVGTVEHTSYWSRDAKSLARRAPIDRGEPTAAVYALHCLIGHHGIFSLTPIWILSVIGMVMMVRRGPSVDTPGSGQAGTSLRCLGVLAIVLSLVCIGFYLFCQGEENRNYGGTTTGLRWVFWLIPLWLAAMVPAADWAGRSRRGRAVSVMLLAVSVFSASYAVWNPWTHPWLAQLMIHFGWVKL